MSLSLNNDISYLQDRLDFEEVLEGLGMEVSHWLGTWIMCHCPFTQNHANGDSSPSFGFNTETMGWNCFVCGGGGILQLVEDLINCNQEAAIQWLTQLSSFEPSENLVDKVTKIMHPVSTEGIMPAYPDEIYEKFETHEYERDAYLEFRNISIEIGKETRIGVDQNHFGITIPHWFDGKLRGWQTRHVLDSCPTCGPNPPKYKNTPNFPKKNTLYLYDFAIGFQALVVESPMSALYLWSMGIPNTMATFGSFSSQQAELLKKFSKVRIWPDNDPAGTNNLFKAVADLGESVDVSIVPVVDQPHGDPADVSADRIHEYLFSAFPIALLPLFEGNLPTLEQAKTYT